MSYMIRSHPVSIFERPILFRLVLSSDGVTGATGKTPVVEISKNGGAFAAPVGAITEVDHGWYKIDQIVADHSTQGPLILHATAADCNPASEVYDLVGHDLTETAAENVWGTEMGSHQGDDSTGVAIWNALRGYHHTAGPGSGAAGVASETVGLQLADVGLDEVDIETGLTLKQAIRGMASILLGKTSGNAASGASSPVFKGAGVETTRVTATTDGVGNRSTVTLSL